MAFFDLLSQKLGGIAPALALCCGLAAWCLPLTGRLIRKTMGPWHTASFLSCCLGLFFPMLYLHRIMLLEDLSAWLDTQGGWTFGTSVLLLGTILVNLLCSMPKRLTHQKEEPQ